MYKKLIILLSVVLLMSCSSGDDQEKSNSSDLTQHVDPFIGTAYHGHTYPGPAMPFGQIQLGPDNGTEGWDWCSGYHYSDSTLYGFSHTHLSGTGIGDLADVSVLPFSQDIIIKDLKHKPGSYKTYKYIQKYSHKNETAKVGYYQVYLETDKINVELTATKRVGFHKYTFSKGAKQQVVFNLDFMQNWDKTYDTYIEKKSPNLLVGRRHSTGWAKNQKLFFAAKFSKDIKDIIYVNKEYQRVKNGGVKCVAIFDNTSGEQLLLKVAISSVSVKNAIENLNTEKNNWDFSNVVKRAKNTWNRELSKFQVKTDNLSLKRTFYTSVYHAFLAPYTFSDKNGEYKGYNDKPTKTNGFTKYTVLSLWDTFRALKPLLLLTERSVYVDVIKSMLAQYKQTGLLPVWELMGNETGTMIGYHSIPVIADAIVKEIDGFDKELAYKAMRDYAMTDLRGLDYYKKMHYIPSDKENESVSKNLEYCFDDWCIAQAAKKLKKTEDYNLFMKRSKYYKNLFDSKLGFFRGKLENGKWEDPFDPKYSKHRDDYFTEGNGWQWLWFVPQDVDGLVELLGGKEKFITKLDQLFSETSEIKGDIISSDITGMVGQYAQGNEPSHSTTFLYSQVGQPEKTQKLVNRILTTLYSDKVDGLCGNEDCGQMSAWYIFSSMGMYPSNPVDGKYYFASPQFDEVKIELFNKKYFTIITKNLSKSNIIIKSATLNGKKLDRSFVTYKEVINGGKLIFEMGK